MISKIINETQTIKINEIISLINYRIKKNSDQKTLTFKSPTGSGKTYMMLKLMNKIIKSDKKNNFYCLFLINKQPSNTNI